MAGGRARRRLSPAVRRKLAGDLRVRQTSHSAPVLQDLRRAPVLAVRRSACGAGQLPGRRGSERADRRASEVLRHAARQCQVAARRDAPPVMTERKRWLAFYLLCAGEFMIVIDTTIINVALPSIQADLAFTESSLVWVVNAYMVTYGGFLLLGGRLGDLFGNRRWFVLGTALFTAASLACALAG